MCGMIYILKLIYYYNRKLWVSKSIFLKTTSKKNYHYIVENFQFSTRQQCEDIVFLCVVSWVCVVNVAVVAVCACCLMPTTYPTGGNKIAIVGREITWKNDKEQKIKKRQ